MKTLLKILLLLLLSFSANAEYYSDNTLFGVSVIRQFADTEVISTGSTFSVSDTGTGFGLYIDKYYARTFRLNSTLNFVAFDEFDLTELMFSADYLIPVNKTLSLYVGLAAGGVMQKFTNTASSDSSVGLGYGAQLGVMNFLSENILLEMGYRFRFSDITTTVGSSPESTITLESFNEFHISMLFMF